MNFTWKSLIILSLISQAANAATLIYRGKTYSKPEEIAKILNAEGVPFERWVVKKGPMTSEEILVAYHDEIQRIKKERGYVSADAFSVNPQTPGLDDLLKKFDRLHYHAEDEVRYVVAGEGKFTILNLKGDDKMIVTVTAGDFIVVPENRKHFFELTPSRAISCIRIFKSKEGWAATYVDK